MDNNIAIIGSSGAIGSALIDQLIVSKPKAIIHAFSRNPLSYAHQRIIPRSIVYDNEQSIANAASAAAENAPLDGVLVATGILHHGEITPEKSLRDLSAEKFQHLFAINTILPALIAKYFIPKLAKDKRTVFAALSARIGSISDNHLGGWYAYRASKAALNMVIKNAAIETARSNQTAIIVGLHPGTVDSQLSKPFQSNVPEGKLFTPAYSAEKLLSVIKNLSEQDSGKCFTWDGQEIQP